MFDTMEAAPVGVGTTARSLTQQIGTSDWRAVMDSTLRQHEGYRDPARWNTAPVPPEVSERAYTNVDKQEDGCWISRYSVASHGYAQVGWQVRPGYNRMVLAHRASWAHVHGQVPIGLTIDHLCKQRRCVNPDHLRMLSNFENSRRNKGDDFPMGECRNGHPNTALVEISRRTKSGAPRVGLTCGDCARMSKQKHARKQVS